jgi:hypothetical protein
MARPTSVIPIERIAGRIYLIRSEKVMLDSDLAELYGVPTSRLNNHCLSVDFPTVAAGFRFNLSNSAALSYGQQNIRREWQLWTSRVPRESIMFSSRYAGRSVWKLIRPCCTLKASGTSMMGNSGAGGGS